jgi:cytochrome c553
MRRTSLFVPALIGSMALGAGAAVAQSEAPAPGTTAPGTAAALQKTVETCGTCHGVNGRSTSPTFPNLAAQQPLYIEAQLKAFKEQTRADPDAQAYMWGMAAQLSDGQITALGDYFSAQPAAPGKPGNAKRIAQGKRLFEEGIPADGVPPCASCHGPTAQGLASFPRLAGQHAAYLYKQLLVIQSVLRTAPVMHGVIKTLTKDQMQAVVAYLESI